MKKKINYITKRRILNFSVFFFMINQVNQNQSNQSNQSKINGDIR